MLSAVAVEDVHEYEMGLYDFLDSDANGATAMDNIRAKGTLDAETEEKLKTALKDYTEKFLKAK